MTPYRSLVTIFGVVAIGLGVALIVQTARVGGGTGYLIGVLFVGPRRRPAVPPAPPPVTVTVTVTGVL